MEASKKAEVAKQAKKAVTLKNIDEILAQVPKD